MPMQQTSYVCDNCYSSVVMAAIVVFVKKDLKQVPVPCPLPENEADRTWWTHFKWSLRHKHVLFQIFFALDEEYKKNFRVYERLFVALMFFSEALLAAGLTEILLATPDEAPIVKSMTGWLVAKILQYAVGSYLAESIFRSDAHAKMRTDLCMRLFQYFAIIATIGFAAVGAYMVSNAFRSDCELTTEACELSINVDEGQSFGACRIGQIGPQCAFNLVNITNAVQCLRMTFQILNEDWRPEVEYPAASWNRCKFGPDNSTDPVNHCRLLFC